MNVYQQARYDRDVAKDVQPGNLVYYGSYKKSEAGLYKVIDVFFDQVTNQLMFKGRRVMKSNGILIKSSSGRPILDIHSVQRVHTQASIESDYLAGIEAAKYKRDFMTGVLEQPM